MSSTSNLDAITRQIESLGVGTPEYHEATAFLLTIMAKRQWIIADQMRRSRARAEKRAAARAAAQQAATPQEPTDD
jgi:hypothetical protein